MHVEIGIGQPNGGREARNSSADDVNGITSTDPAKVIADPALPKVCAPLVERARTHFDKADDVNGPGHQINA
jgi:hypothetical protein